MRITNHRGRDQGDESVKNPHLDAINEAWSRILPHLQRRDPRLALEEWGRSVPMLHQALACRMEDWFITLLALPRTEEHNYTDTQGLNRLIYRIWKEVPTRTFYPEMIKDLFAAMARGEHKLPPEPCAMPKLLDSRAHAQDQMPTQMGITNNDQQ